MQFSLIDILFIITVALLVFNGLRNGAIFSLVNLIGIPLGIGAAIIFGPRFTALLAANGLPATPLISYAVLFLGTVLVLHIIGTMVRGVVQRIPIIGLGDSLLGGAIGFVEAWLLWLFLLIVLGTFLGNLQNEVHIVNGLPLVGNGLQFDQLQSWHGFYNEAVTNSLFAKVNGFFIKQLPNLPKLP
ncbi:MAG TPA: CvpA family protein [Ktedonosporobacter sp.]|nr:CvpA family protein [Ktedonosporobacter sp.]